jgi:hypothetical protein
MGRKILVLLGLSPAFAGSMKFLTIVPGADAPGFILSPAIAGSSNHQLFLVAALQRRVLRVSMVLFAQ